MDDATAVGRSKSIGHLNANLDDLWNSQRRGVHSGAKRLPVHEFHDDQRPAFVLAKIVDRANVGVIESRRGARFDAQTLENT
jgi:hypothetical protein